MRIVKRSWEGTRCVCWASAGAREVLRQVPIDIVIVADSSPLNYFTLIRSVDVLRSRRRDSADCDDDFVRDGTEAAGVPRARAHEISARADPCGRQRWRSAP